MPTLRVPTDLLALLMDLPEGVELRASVGEDGAAAVVDGTPMVEVHVEPSDDHALQDGQTYALHYDLDEDGEPSLIAFVPVP